VQLVMSSRVALRRGQPHWAKPQIEAAGVRRFRLGLLRRPAGRSNREIGDALFITPKTASVHISNILRKLQVTSRVQAATAAHRLGLVDEDHLSG
jgi:Bacterial regulatory proteins, luxR family